MHGKMSPLEGCMVLEWAFSISGGVYMLICTIKGRKTQRYNVIITFQLRLKI